MRTVEKLKDMDWKNSKLLWFSVALGLLGFLIYIADIDQFIEAISQADPGFFAVAFIFGMSTLFFWSWVWYRFFGKMDIDAGIYETVKMFLAGHFLNAITPLGQFGGEPFLAYIISSNTDTDYETALTSVVSSDMINYTPFFTFISGGIIYLALFRSVEGFLLEIAYMTIVLAIVAGTGAYLLWYDSNRIESGILKILNFIGSRIEHGDRFIESAKESLRKMKRSFKIAGSDPKFLLKTSLISHLAIVGQILSLYFILLSLGFDPDFTPIYFVVALSGIATFSPTPGGSGTFEAAFSGLMMLFFQINLATALTSAILFRLTTYWPGMGIGYLALLNLRRSGKVDKEDLK